MKTEFQLHWQSSAPLGATSSGVSGWYATREEAEAAKREAEAEFAAASASERQLRAETSFHVVHVSVDEFGNATEIG